MQASARFFERANWYRKAVITVALADGYANFSVCGLPFFLSGETPDWHQLAHRTEFQGIKLLPWHTAVSIDLGQRVTLIDRENRPWDPAQLATQNWVSQR